MGDLKSMNPQMRALRPGEQIPVTPEMMKNAVQGVCECGCTHFQQGANVFIISALLSPIGQKLFYPASTDWVCMKCKKVLK